MDIKILAICGTPIKGEVTNTEYMLKEVIRFSEVHAKQLGDKVKTDLVLLGEDKIKSGCTHCNWCLNSQTADVFCSIKDDLSKEIYPKVVEADGLILGTPVYFGGMSWLMASFVHRMRALAEGCYYGIRGPYGGVLQDKILATTSVAWGRHLGVETAMITELLAGFVFDMVITGAGLEGLYGAGGGSAAPLDQLVAVKKDKVAMAGCQALGKRVVERCRVIKAGKKALKYLPAYL